ncbi:b6 [Drosophila busckii]|uniref:B6 n=1 Tax=Drosophila busckii TaxID=30019 RepID=A0A0M3QYT6_DROBS|nr:uncharacterized protein LOC108606292 [Drosophila busckii]ALC48179.1 b6 [Drosophila busckii]
MLKPSYSLAGCVLLITLSVCLAWKPIASSSSPITAYSLKQSHPGEASSSHELATSYSQFNANKPDESFVFQADASSSSKALTLADEDIGQYDSYSLEDEPQQQQHIIKSSFGSAPAAYAADRCSVKKFAFNQDGIVDYNNKLPELEQFTTCLWMRFTNHSGDHVLFTYETEKETREIQIWVANAQNSSFLSMAIKGQQMYRLNYPLRMRQWHHMCSSWNGKTGEWQVWLKAERIGRGFHNSLVGYKIPANGKMRSGGSSITGEVIQGLHFEVTLVQVYRVALSAGKAHRDHKHHHVHHFDHEGQELSSTPRAPPVINRPQPMHSLLASGQIPSRVRLNLAGPTPSQMPAQDASTQPQLTLNTNFVNGQINAGSRLVAQQLLATPASRLPATPNNAARFQMLSNSANVQFIDETETHIQFKRHTNKSKLQKRELVLLDNGAIVDDAADAAAAAAPEELYNGLADFGDQQFKQDLTHRMNLEQEVSTHDREPAEEEVKAVMAMCSSCDPEPFQGAIVFAWKNVSEHMDNTLKGLSVGTCGHF